MKIAVTGGAGFIASHIVDAYVALGHDVVVIDNMSSGNAANVNPKARLVRMDIRDASIEDLFKAECFELLNHHAAQIDVRVSVNDPVFDASVNVVGSLNLYKAAVKNGVKKILFASSAGTVYGEQSTKECEESHPKNPLAPYGVSKLANEHYLYALHYAGVVDYFVMRYSNVYGPRQNPHGEAGVIAIFLNKMLNGEQPVINGDGTQTRDYVFVSDIVHANVLGLSGSATGIYNFSTAREVNVNEILQHLNSATGLDIKEVHGDAKPGEQRRGCYSFQKAADELGWKPAVSFDEGIRRTAEWFRSKR